MSIIAIVQDAKTEEEKLFNIPISTEKFFKEVWLPLAKDLDLQWIPVFQTGIEILKEDLPNIFSELDKLEELAKRTLNKEQFSQIHTRLNLIRDNLPDGFIRDGAVIYIG
ncbi:MAG: hypothetical protein ACKE51_06475 [Methylococcaceae bacterium]